jgi:hypothetical protein
MWSWQRGSKYDYINGLIKMDFNLKQIMGFVLLIFMLVTSIALFGGISHEKQPVVANIPLNVTNTSEIMEYHQATFEEHASIDLGAISLILLLIGITSVGGIVNGDGKDE